MANKNGRWKIIATIASLVVIGAGVVANYTLQGAEIDVLEKDVEKLDTEGCNVSVQNEKSIIGIEKDVEYTKETVSRIELEQRVIREDMRNGFGELKALIKEK